MTGGQAGGSGKRSMIVALLVTLAALLAIPYALSVWPYRSLTDEQAERANAGWKRFLALNFLTGFLVTLLLILFWLAT